MMKTRLKDKISRLAASLGVFAVALGFAPQAVADYVWNSTTGGDWCDSANWNGDSGNYVVDWLNGAENYTITFSQLAQIDSGDVYIKKGINETVTFSADANCGINMTSTGVFGIGGNNWADLTINGGSYSFAGPIKLAYEKAHWEDRTTGILTIQSGTVNAARGIVLGAYNGSADSAATLNINGGTVSTTSITRDYGTGTLTLNGGTLQAYSSGTLIASGVNVTVGSNGGTIDTAYDVTIAAAVTGSGNITKTGSGKLTFTGDMSGYTGTITVDGGTVEYASSVTCNPYNMGLGVNTSMTVNGATLNVATTGSGNDPWISSGASFTMTNGSATFGVNASAKWTKIYGGTVNLNGGELAVCRFTCDGGAEINFDGGTLASYDAGNWKENIIGGTSFDSGTITLKVLAGGAIIDTRTCSTTITPVMTSGVTEGSDGGLVKKGTGTLTLAAVPTFNGGVKLQDGSIKIPNGYSSVNVTTDVDGYEVVPSVGESFTTYTLAKPAITWKGGTDNNWNTPGNWSGNAVPTANDNVEITANTTITLDEAAYAATITADSSVTIVSSAFDYATGLKSAFQNTSWHGTYRIEHDISSSDSDKLEIQGYGNADSTIEFSGTRTIYRINAGDRGSNAQTFNGTLKITGSLTQTKGFLRNNTPHYTTIGKLAGNGYWTVSDGDDVSTGYRQGFVIKDGSAFTGSLNAQHDNFYCFASATTSDQGVIWIQNNTAVLGDGATWQGFRGLKIGAYTVTVKGNANLVGGVKMLSGATFSYDALGTVSIGATGALVAPTFCTALTTSDYTEATSENKATINIAFGNDVTLADGALLMEWSAESVPENVEFVFADSTLNDDWVLTASETGLLLNTKNPVATVDGTNYSSLSAALKAAGDTSSITLQVSSAEAITLKGTQTLTIPLGVEYTGALTIASPTAEEKVAPTLDLNAATTVSSVTVNSGATFNLPTDYALMTGENALAIGGAGWVKVSDSSAYSGVAVSVSEGTLDVPAGSTFKDIAASTVYVSGTITGTTVDADGTISNGTTLFTLTDGTFANATVTVSIGGVNTAIHYTNNNGTYTAGKVFYWVGVNEGITESIYWSSDDTGSDAAVTSETPTYFDTGIFGSVANSKATINNVSLFYNVKLTGNHEFNHGGNTAAVNFGNSSYAPVIQVGANVTATFKARRGSQNCAINIYAKVIGNGKVSVSAEKNGDGVYVYGDVSEFTGEFVARTPSDNPYPKIRLVGDSKNKTFTARLSKWDICSNGSVIIRNDGNYANYSPYIDSYTLKFGALTTYLATSHNADSTAYSNKNITFELGEELNEDSCIRNNWGSQDATYGGKVKWMAKTATFTQAAENAYEVDVMGGGYVYVEQNSTEGSEASYVPSVIKFLEFTDSEGNKRSGGYLTIDDNNAAIAGDIVNAIAAAGSGETQAAVGFNVTAESATAAVTSWSALAAGGVVKKGAGTLTLTGTPSGTVKITVEAGELVTPNTLDYTPGDALTKVKAGENGTYVFYKATGIATTDTAEITEVADQTAADAIAAGYVVTLTEAQEKQGLSADYYTVKATAKAGAENTYVLTPVLKDEVKPEVAEGVTVEGTTVTIPATNLKKGLYYRVVASADVAGTGTKTTGAWEPYSGSGSLSLTATLPTEGVLYYAIEASDAAE